MNDKRLKVWPEKQNKSLYLLMLVALLLLVAAVDTLIYMTGGLKYVYVHLMYIPIILSSIVFGVRGGIFISLFAGLTLGPLMPLEVSTGEQQNMYSWLFRCGFFTLLGALCGQVSDSIRVYISHIKWLSHHDISSSLPNRAALSEQLKHISTKLAEATEQYILAIISIENEKELLSTFDITVLDNAVVQMAKQLQEKEAQRLSIFRINPAQIAVLINGVSNRNEKSFFDKLSTGFGDPIQYQEIPIHIDVRIGYVAISDAQETPEFQLQKAQSALREACYKACDYVGFNPAISTANRENVVMLGELKNALTAHQLSLHYQPKIDIATGMVDSVEALLRWQHPQKGNIPPGVFIPRAEESTLINQITFFVLDQAMAQIALWQQLGINITVAVNISAQNLLQPDFSSVVFCLLERHGLDGKQLELEITESALMLDVKRAIIELNKLSAANITLSIDDFGTGYSSLQYLHQLPVSFLKIDQSFVYRLPTDKSAISIVETAVSMAHKMNIKTIAEGIENKETYYFLKKIGCDMAQGYMISRPLPAKEYIKWHTEHNNVLKNKNKATKPLKGKIYLQHFFPQS